MTKAKTISLLELCRTGQFGALKIGSSEREMTTFLGEPTGWGVDPTPGETYCHYGDVQFFFHNTNSLYLIHIDWFSGKNHAPILSKPHQLESWALHGDANQETIEHALHSASLPFQTESKFESIVLKLESNVEIAFSSDTCDLYAISVLLRSR